MTAEPKFRYSNSILNDVVAKEADADKAKNAGMPKVVIDKMKQIEKEKRELDKLFADYSK